MITRLLDYEALGHRSKAAYDRARQVIGHARTGNTTIATAIADLRSRGVGTTVATVRRYFGDAIERDYRGRLVASGSDRNIRIIKILATDGPTDVVARGWRPAQILAQHEAAVRAYLYSGDDAALRRWEARYGDRRFRTPDGEAVEPETDIDVIEERDQFGEISTEDIYAEVA